MPNSGATLHVFTIESSSSDDYKQCTDVFVFIACIRLNGEVQIIPEPLHVPGLD